jgi:hypothetical protein
MSYNIFVKKREFTSLEGFARSVFRLLQFENVEEHESVNYWGGQYYSACKDNACLTVALQDHAGFPEYDYWLFVEMENFEEEVELGRKLAQALVLNDFEVATPFSKEDWIYERSVVKRILYRSKKSNGDTGGQTGVEETLEYFKVP